MTDEMNLSSQFLIAMPSLADPNFAQTVTIICEHNDEGALGLVINRPTDLKLAEIFSHMGIEVSDIRAGEQPVYMGGPVQPDRGFVLHRPGAETWESTMDVCDGISVTTSRDILAAMARGEGPDTALVALGYAGWGPGQLESEIRENAWLSIPADASIVFDTPSDERIAKAAALMGIDLHALAGHAGQA